MFCVKLKQVIETRLGDILRRASFVQINACMIIGAVLFLSCVPGSVWWFKHRNDPIIRTDDWGGGRVFITVITNRQEIRHIVTNMWTGRGFELRSVTITNYH